MVQLICSGRCGLLLFRRRQLPVARRKKGTDVAPASSPSWRAHAPSPPRRQQPMRSNTTNRTTAVVATSSMCWRGRPSPAPARPSRSTMTVTAPHSAASVVLCPRVRVAPPSVGRAVQMLMMATAFNDEPQLYAARLMRTYEHNEFQFGTSHHQGKASQGKANMPILIATKTKPQSF